MIYLYTDGSSNGRSDKPYGWAYVLVSNKRIIAYGYGGGKTGTNNIAELQAAIKGLNYIAKANFKEPVTLVSDSQYVLGIATGVYTPSKNLELCDRLTTLFNSLDVVPKWVKGHSGNRYNEIADKLSKSARERGNIKWA